MPPSPLAAAALLLATLVSTAALAAGPPKVIAVVAPVAGSAFYDAVGDGCRDRATRFGPWECRFYAPGGDEKRSEEHTSELQSH